MSSCPPFPVRGLVEIVQLVGILQQQSLRMPAGAGTLASPSVVPASSPLPKCLAPLTGLKLPPLPGSIPSVPNGNAKPSAAPTQQPGMARSGSPAGSPTAAGSAGGLSAAEVEALRAAAAAAEQRHQQAQQAQQAQQGAAGSGEGEGEGGDQDETAGAQFKAAEAKLMKVCLCSDRTVLRNRGCASVHMAVHPVLHSALPSPLPPPCSAWPACAATERSSCPSSAHRPCCGAFVCCLAGC